MADLRIDGTARCLRRCIGATWTAWCDTVSSIFNQNRSVYLKIQLLPHSKHVYGRIAASMEVINTQLMLTITVTYRVNYAHLP
jgi:hypothetical protein